MNDSLTFPTEGDLNAAEKISSAVAHARAFTSIPELADPADRMRQEKHREWLQCAVPATLGSAPPNVICAEWSNFADAFLRKAFQDCFSTPMALFAMGKLGSSELNLSSDVDLILVSLMDEPTQSTGLRKFQRLLSEVRPTGFVLRTDFDLRPGGRLGPLIPTIDQLIDYYGNYGETWERMAFVRLRPIAGEGAVIQPVLDFVQRFCYRRHLDFGLLEDLKSMRHKIHAEHWQRSADGWVDLKLGVGGIRDVELFFHALQVIHGGKDASLRTRGTEDAGQKLAERGLLPLAEAEFLIQHYWNLRELENYVQALDDKQTHRLQPQAPHPPWVQEKLVGLQDRMGRCDQLVSDLLGQAPPTPSTEELRKVGLALADKSLFEEVLQIPLLSRNKAKDEGTRKAFLQTFLVVLQEQKADSQMAVAQLREFLKSTRAKASFYDLLLREEKLLKELAWIFGHSQYLGRILCYRPELLDAFVFRNQDLRTDDLEALLENFVEKRLLAEIIEGSRFLRDQDLLRTTEALSTTADGIVVSLLQALKKETPSDVEILALGKWGGREMGFRSDLDFVFITPGDPLDADFKMARRMISRLTEPHRGGNIYPIDLRLRPSGKAGPIVMSAKELKSYLEQTAAPWERQAYLRARWLGAPLFDIRPCLLNRKLAAEDFVELNRIRVGLQAKPDVLDLKYSEGGLVDLELFGQTVLLGRGTPTPAASTPQILAEIGESDLLNVYMRLRQIEQIGQLAGAQIFSRIDENTEFLQGVAAMLQLPDQAALQGHIRGLLTLSCTALGRLDPRRTSG